MAACRGLDVLLGASPGRPVAAALPRRATVAAHTYTVTALSRAEVQRRPRRCPPRPSPATAAVAPSRPAAAAASRPGTARQLDPRAGRLVRALRYGARRRRGPWPTPPPAHPRRRRRRDHRAAHLQGAARRTGRRPRAGPPCGRRCAAGPAPGAEGVPDMSGRGAIRLRHQRLRQPPARRRAGGHRRPRLRGRGPDAGPRPPRPVRRRTWPAGRRASATGCAELGLGGGHRDRRPLPARPVAQARPDAAGRRPGPAGSTSCAGPSRSARTSAPRRSRFWAGVRPAGVDRRPRLGPAGRRLRRRSSTPPTAAGVTLGLRTRAGHARRRRSPTGARLRGRLGAPGLLRPHPRHRALPLPGAVDRVPDCVRQVGRRTWSTCRSTTCAGACTSTWSSAPARSTSRRCCGALADAGYRRPGRRRAAPALATPRPTSPGRSMDFLRAAGTEPPAVKAVEAGTEPR